MKTYVFHVTLHYSLIFYSLLYLYTPPPAKCVCVLAGSFHVVRLSVRDGLVFQYLEKAMMEFHKILQTYWYPQDEHL